MSGPYVRMPASELRPGDRLPLIGFGLGAEVATTGQRATFAEPVHSRWMPDRMLDSISFQPDDVVTVARQCEAVWPSPVTGGQTDAQCVEYATAEVAGLWVCPECAKELDRE